jgi:hypothetical protein
MTGMRRLPGKLLYFSGAGRYKGRLVARCASSVYEMRIYHVPAHPEPWWVTDDLPQVYRRCMTREEAEGAAKEILRSATGDILHQSECLRGV